MDANNTNLIAKNSVNHACMSANSDDSIECAPSIYCRLLVNGKY